jgi:hypothetical protein
VAALKEPFHALLGFALNPWATLVASQCSWSLFFKHTKLPPSVELLHSPFCLSKMFFPQIHAASAYYKVDGEKHSSLGKPFLTHLLE